MRVCRHEVKWPPLNFQVFTNLKLNFAIKKWFKIINVTS